MLRPDNNNSSNFKFLFVSVNIGKCVIVDDQFHEIKDGYVTLSNMLFAVLDEWLQFLFIYW